ncbi:MAG: ribokinase [Actinomycetaceae bacterium]|nr:ribokinase [Actinomycetaceae bacterium]
MANEDTTQQATTARTALTALETMEATGGKVCVFGSINADVTVETERLPGPGETVHGGPLQILPGGKSANQSVASALLGAPTVIIGAVGNDPNGQILLGSMRQAGVDTSNVSVREGATGTAVITFDHSGENTIVISAGANGTLSAHDIESHVDSVLNSMVLGLCLEVDTDLVTQVATLAHDAHVTTVLNVSPAKEVPQELLDVIDVLIVNQHELSTLMRRNVDPADHQAVRASMSHLGVSRLVITLGAAGSLVFEDDQATQVPAFKVDAIDTTGAGDSFMGTLLACLASNIPIAEGASLAAAVSALSATKVGAQASYASADEVRSFLQEN